VRGGNILLKSMWPDSVLAEVPKGYKENVTWRTRCFDAGAEGRGEGGLMPLCLTLVPTAWTREAGQHGPNAYGVYGLPSEKHTVISMCPGGWRVVRYTLVQFDHGRVYSSAEEAAAALKTWIEGREQPTKAEE
jgi:hypothetical protein